MRWTRVIGAAWLGLAAACSGSSYSTYGGGGGGGGGPAANQVFMQSSAFNPTTRTVAAGTTVQWVNQDPISHTVTSSSGPGTAFDSGTLAGGASYSQTFSVAGTYQYYCKIHGAPGTGMHGTVVVQ